MVEVVKQRALLDQKKPQELLFSVLRRSVCAGVDWCNVSNYGGCCIPFFFSRFIKKLGIEKKRVGGISLFVGVSLPGF